MAKICSNCNEEIVGMVFKKGKKSYCEACMYEIDGEWADWCLLFEYVKELYHVKQPSLQIITQLKKYNKDNKLSYYGMYTTLRYVYDILGKELDEDKGVGIIPYYYDKAKDFLNKKYKIEDNIDDYEMNTVVATVSTKINYGNTTLKKNISMDTWKTQEDD